MITRVDLWFIQVATLSARKMGIELWLDGRVGGIYIDEHLEVEQKRQLVSLLITR